MLADPLTLTKAVATGATDAVIYGAGTTSWAFVCTGRGPTSSTYRYVVSSTHFVDLFIGHIYGKRNRYTVRLTETELVTDVIDSTKNSQKVTSAYFVIDTSPQGTGTNFANMCNSLTDFLLTSHDGTPYVTNVLAGET